MSDIGKELVVKSTEIAIADDELVAIAEHADKRIAAVKKIISIALKVTSEKDWVNQNGKPYLQGIGAEAVANMFGVSWRFVEKPYKVSEEEGNYRYETVLELSYRGRSIEVVGARSTKDTFFSTRYKWDEKEKKNIPYKLPVSEIDSSDIMKASITNAIGSGVTRILGIRNATWEMLKEAGLDTDKIGKIEYKKEEMSEEAKDLKAETHNMLVKIYGENYSDALEKITSFTGKDGNLVKGKKTLAGLSEKALQVTYAKVKELYQKESGKHPPTSATEEKVEKRPSITTEQFIKILQTTKTKEAFDKAWNQYYSENYTAEEKESLMEWRDKKMAEFS